MELAKNILKKLNSEHHYLVVMCVVIVCHYQVVMFVVIVSRERHKQTTRMVSGMLRCYEFTLVQ